MKKIVGAVVASLVLASPAALASTTRTVAIDRAYDASVLQQINDLRAQHGLAPLRLSRELSLAAAVHTRDMVSVGFFSHESSDGAPFWKRLQRYYGSKGFHQWSVGENLVWGSPDLSSSDAVASWLQSPEHRRNMLSRAWREIGLAAVHVPSAPGLYGDHEATVVTADFGTRS